MLAQKQQELIDDLNLIHDPHERLAALTSRRVAFKLEKHLLLEQNLVKGCVSRVWLACRRESGRCTFQCEADSPMVAGLVALLCDLYSGNTPEEIVAVEPEVWEKAGLARLLSPTRLNGLAAVRSRIRELASEPSP